MAEYYRSEAPIGRWHIAALVAATAGIAVATGAAQSLFGRSNLAAYGKLLVGPAVAVTLWFVVARGRIGRPTLAAGFAAAAVVGAFLSTYWFDFSAERNQAIAKLVDDRNYGVESRDEDRAVANEVMHRKLATVTFTQHLRRRVGLGSGHEGLRGQHSVGTTVDGVFEVLAILLALLIAVSWVRRRAARPSCRRCGRWLSGELAARLRHGGSQRLVARLVGGHDISDIVAPPDTRENIEIVRWRCAAHHDDDAPVVSVADVEHKRSRVLVRRARAQLRMSATEFGAIVGGAATATADDSSEQP